jgi:hypothetical protein
MTSNYEESQVDRLCAKHAVNHLLQEEKVIYNPGLSSRYVNKGTGSSAPESSNPKDPNIQINLDFLCKDISTGTDPEMNCDSDGQNLPIFGLIIILEHTLGFETRLLDSAEHTFWSTITSYMKDPTLLGIIFNLNGTHYTVLSRYIKNCSPSSSSSSSSSSSMFVYADSEAKKTHMPILYCINETASIPYLKTLKIRAAVCVFDSSSAYNCLSIQRLRNPPFPGGTRRIRKRSKRSRRNKRY